MLEINIGFLKSCERVINEESDCFASSQYSYMYVCTYALTLWQLIQKAVIEKLNEFLVTSWIISVTS